MLLESDLPLALALRCCATSKQLHPFLELIQNQTTRKRLSFPILFLHLILFRSSFSSPSVVGVIACDGFNIIPIPITVKR